MIRCKKKTWLTVPTIFINGRKAVGNYLQNKLKTVSVFPQLQGLKYVIAIFVFRTNIKIVSIDP